MANVPLKTIKFPGLDDTYTIPQVDNTLAVTGAAADAKKTGDEITDVKEALTKKAPLTGTAQDLVSGSAEQLLSDVGTEDKTPYLFRATPYDSTRVDEEIVGVSVGWNQLFDFTGVSRTVTSNGITMVISNGVAVFNGTTETNGAFEFWYRENKPETIVGHVYMYWVNKVSGTHTGTVNFVLAGIGNAATGTGTTPRIGKAVLASDRYDCYIAAGTATDYTLQFQVIDLTAWFGTAIADYARTLETATAGSGVAFIKALLPGGYLPYSAPTLKSVEGLSAHVMRGFNQWDEEWEVGTIDGNGNNAASGTGNQIRSKNYYPILPNTVYYATCGKTDGGSDNKYYLYICYYDSDKNYILQTFCNNVTFTTPANAAYFRLHTNSSTVVYGNTYNHDICINLSDPARNGQYEPYKATTYALDSDLTLRGILKMDADHKLYAEGDVYESDGTVTRKYAEVDLGSLDWTKDTSSISGVTAFYSDVITDRLTNSTNLVCAKYTTVSARNDLQSTNMGIASWQSSSVGATSQRVGIRDDTLASGDATAFKTAVTGIKLVYEVLNPTTEIADPFVSPQIIDPDGTEEYVYADGGSGIPVGHNSKYPANLRAEVERVMVAVPSAPSENGTYSLKCTVASGTPSYAWVADT